MVSVFIICLTDRSSSSASNELIVVTLLVAAEGGLKLPKVTSLEELRSALNTLGGISESQVQIPASQTLNLLAPHFNGCKQMQCQVRCP